MKTSVKYNFIFMTLISILIFLTACNDKISGASSAIVGSPDNKFQIVVNTDGTISINGEPDKSLNYDFKDWDNIKSVSIGAYNVGAVKNNGSVLITGENDTGVLEASKWNDIVMLKFTFHAVFGLKKDGTIVYAGIDTEGEESLFNEVKQWNDIKSIETSWTSIIGIKNNGDVVGAGVDQKNIATINDWHNIKAISVSRDKIVGLTDNGEIVFADFKGYPRPYEELKGAIKVCTSNKYVAALMPNGTIKIRNTIYPAWPSINGNSSDITNEEHENIQSKLADNLKKLQDESDIVDINVNLESLSILKKDGTILIG